MQSTETQDPYTINMTDGMKSTIPFQFIYSFWMEKHPTFMIHGKQISRKTAKSDFSIKYKKEESRIPQNQSQL